MSGAEEVDCRSSEPPFKASSPSEKPVRIGKRLGEGSIAGLDPHIPKLPRKTEKI